MNKALIISLIILTGLVMLYPLPTVKKTNEFDRLKNSQGLEFATAFTYCIKITDSKRATECLIELYGTLKKYESDQKGK